MLKNSLRWILLANTLWLIGCGATTESNAVADNDYETISEDATNETDETAIDELDSENSSDDVSVSEFEVALDILTEEEFAQLDNYTEVNYRTARGVGGESGLIVRFNFSQPVTDFALIDITHTASENLLFVKTGVLSEVGSLNPETPLILTDYFGMGTLPVSGFFFLDASGAEHWFTFQQSMKDGLMYAQPFSWSSEYELYNVELAEPYARAQTHTAQQGETLFSIARLYQTTVEFLQFINDLGTSTDIQAGQLIYLTPPEFSRNNCGIVDLTAPNCDLASNGTPFTRRIGAGGITLLEPPQTDPDSITLARITELRNELEGMGSPLHEEGWTQPWTFPFVATLMYYSTKWDVEFDDPTYQQRIKDYVFATAFLDRAEETYRSRN